MNWMQKNLFQVIGFFIMLASAFASYKILDYRVFTIEKKLDGTKFSEIEKKINDSIQAAKEDFEEQRQYQTTQNFYFHEEIGKIRGWIESQNRRNTK